MHFIVPHFISWNQCIQRSIVVLTGLPVHVRLVVRVLSFHLAICVMCMFFVVFGRVHFERVLSL